METGGLRRHQEIGIKFFAANRDQSSALQGFTGCGKTRIISYVAQSYKDGFTLIAFPFHQLKSQFLDSIDDWQSAGIRREEIGIFFAKSAYVSTERVRSWRARGHPDLEDPIDGELCEAYIERLDIEDKLSAGDICLKTDCSKEVDSAAWQAYEAGLNDLVGKRIILVTISALLLEAMTERYLPVKPDRIIIDEADQLDPMARLLFDRTISREELDKLRGNSKKQKLDRITQEAIDFLYKRLDRLEAEKMEDPDRLLSLRSRIRAFEKHLGGKNVGVERGDWKMLHFAPSRIINRLWRDTPTSFLSATLTVKGDFSDFWSIIGSKPSEVPYTVIEPTGEFGKLYINQYRLLPHELKEFDAKKRDADVYGLHYAYPTDFGLTLDCLRNVQGSGQTCLVILPSRVDCAKMGELIGDDPDVIVRGSNEPLKKAVARFESSAAKVFVIYGGYIGLDIKKCPMQNLILPRIPFAPPNTILRLGATPKQWLLRRLKQLIGRIIRRATDVATLWILDGRFPVHSEFSARFYGSNNYFAQHTDLPQCFEKRFLFSNQYGYRCASAIERVEGGGIRVNDGL